MYENSSDQMISMTLFRWVTGRKMMMIHKSGDADSGVIIILQIQIQIQIQTWEGR